MSDYQGYFLWRQGEDGELVRTHHRPTTDPHLTTEDNEKRGWKSDQAARQYARRHGLTGLTVRREGAAQYRRKPGPGAGQ